MIYCFQHHLQARVEPDEDSAYGTAPLPTREQQLASLQEGEFDVLVIGGGCTGCGVALDSISRGKSLDSELQMKMFTVYIFSSPELVLRMR